MVKNVLRLFLLNNVLGNDGHQGNITCIAVLPAVSEQNNTFISGSVDGTMHLYNFKTGKVQ